MGADTWTQRLVQIEEINGDLADCIDEMGRHVTISTLFQRAKGAKPRVGEQWIIDRAFGRWSFAAIVNAQPPTVSGARDDGTALASLLTALADAGLIVNATTAT